MKTKDFRFETEANSVKAKAAEVEKQFLGLQLLNEGKLTEDDINRIVAVQTQTNARFGEIAIKLGLIGEAELQQALARQFDYPISTLGDSSLSPTLIAASQPFGAATEQYRLLRTQIMQRWFTDQRQSIAVCASRSGDGASTLAANLAITFAQLGERTLLIDANLRRPSQHLLFGLNPTVGLSDLLVGRATLASTLVDVPSFQTLTVMCSGALPPNPQELLGRLAFSYLLESAPATYDVVVVDTSPVLDSADAQLVAARVGGCVLATRRHVTAVSDIEETKAALEPSGVKIVGAVIRG
jgi:chain length determinant protein tyrosine kinase EpsG